LRAWPCRAVEPLRSWEISFAGEDEASGFDLRFEALSAPAGVAPGSPVAELGGMVGYEQVCRVTGMARVDARPGRSAGSASAGTPGAPRTGIASR
jgi:hypothetical protein